MQKRKRKIIGITGNIASGKSTVLHEFEKLGLNVFSADNSISLILKKNHTVRNLISIKFGEKIIDSNLIKFKQNLANLIFTSPKKKKILEKILHKEIEAELFSTINKLKSKKDVAIEIPLLFEAKWENKVDVIILVKTPKVIRRKFFKGTKHDFERRDQSQQSSRSKIHKSHFIIDNKKDLLHLKKQVQEIYNNILDITI